MVGACGGAGSAADIGFDRSKRPAETRQAQADVSAAPVVNKSFDQFTSTTSLFPTQQSPFYSLFTPATPSFAMDQTVSPAGLGGSQVLQIVLMLLTAILKGKGSQQNDIQAGKPSGKAEFSKPDPNGPKPNISEGKGWNKNVSVFTTVQANETSSGTATVGYFSSLKKGLAKGLSLRDAHDSVNLDYQTRTRTEAPEDSFVKGRGGKILVVGGDNISQKECDEHAAELKKAYGADVEVVANCSPAKLKAKMQEMSKDSGEQVLVDILAHGAKDDSGQNNGNMAMGKGEGDQWLHEQALKDMVNQYLAPNYKNVNVLIESCYSGNFVQ